MLFATKIYPEGLAKIYMWRNFILWLHGILFLFVITTYRLSYEEYFWRFIDEIIFHGVYIFASALIIYLFSRNILAEDRDSEISLDQGDRLPSSNVKAVENNIVSRRRKLLPYFPDLTILFTWFLICSSLGLDFMWSIIVSSTTFFIMPALRFAKRNGSKYIFLSTGVPSSFYLILFFLLVTRGYFYGFGDGFGGIELLIPPFMILFYFLLSLLVYFLWPKRFEPKFDATSYLNQKRKMGKWFIFTSTITLLVITIYIVFIVSDGVNGAHYYLDTQRNLDVNGWFISS